MRFLARHSMCLAATVGPSLAFSSLWQVPIFLVSLQYRSHVCCRPSGGASGFSTGAAVYGGVPQLFSQTAGSNPFH